MEACSGLAVGVNRFEGGGGGTWRIRMDWSRTWLEC